MSEIMDNSRLTGPSQGLSLPIQDYIKERGMCLSPHRDSNPRSIIAGALDRDAHLTVTVDS